MSVSNFFDNLASKVGLGPDPGKKASKQEKQPLLSKTGIDKDAAVAQVKSPPNVVKPQDMSRLDRAVAESTKRGSSMSVLDKCLMTAFHCYVYNLGKLIDMIPDQAMAKLGLPRNPLTPKEEATYKFMRAVEYNNLSDAKKYLKQGAELNCVDSSGRSALAWATLNESESMVELLSRQPGIKFTDTIITALETGNSKIIEKFRKPEFRAAHDYSYQLRLFIGRYGFGTQELERFQNAWSSVIEREMKNSFSDFMENNKLTTKVSFQKVKDALDNISSSENDVPKALSRIKKGEIVAISAGAHGKGPALVIYKDFVFICNRGSDSERPGIEIFRMGNAKNLEKTLNLILEELKYKGDSKLTRSTLIERLNLSPEHHIPHSYLSNENGTHAAAKLMAEAAACADLIASKGIPNSLQAWKAIENEARPFYKAFTTFDREVAVKDLLKLIREHSEDLTSEKLLAIGVPPVPSLVIVLVSNLRLPEQWQSYLEMEKLINEKPNLFSAEDRQEIKKAALKHIEEVLSKNVNLTVAERMPMMDYLLNQGAKNVA